MAPVNNNEKKTWREINKAHKEERKKWKERNLAKKIEKQKLKEQAESISDSESENKTQLEELSTISLAVPGSILENAQSAELRTYLAGQIARAACLFQVDEVIVYDDYGKEASAKNSTTDDGIKLARQCCVQLGRILQYLECPQYLRKHFFPIHNDLRFAGILNPLDAPHHLRQDDNFEFREGIVTNKPTKSGRGSQVNVGLLQNVHIDKLLTPGLRCTVKLVPTEQGNKKLKGILVSPSTPRRQSGVYWGYTVRLADSLSQLFSECPYKEGYDVTIGTSDKGNLIDEFESQPYQHLLIVFGGLQGLELALECDEVLQADDPRLLFDYYLNTLPNQGSRTIRTEEAILISLAALRPKIIPKNQRIEFIKENNIITYDKTCNVKSDDDMCRFD